MNYYLIPAALIVAFLITLIFSLFSKRPLGGLWVFFFLLFMVTWSGQLWITPFGPIFYGVTWIPLVIIPLFFIFFILAMAPPATPKNTKENGEPAGAFIALGLFFWVMMILLVISVILGYYRATL